MVLLDLTEAAISRAAFNSVLRIDTFVDSVAVLSSRKAFVLAFLVATHVVTDLYLALNKNIFCDAYS